MRGLAMYRIIVIGKDRRARHRVTLNGGVYVFPAAVRVFCQKVKRVSVARSFQLVAAQLACQFVALLLKFKLIGNGSAIIIGGKNPASGERVLVLTSKKSQSRQHENKSEVHEFSSRLNLDYWPGAMLGG